MLNHRVRDSMKPVWLFSKQLLLALHLSCREKNVEATHEAYQRKMMAAHAGQGEFPKVKLKEVPGSSAIGLSAQDKW